VILAMGLGIAVVLLFGRSTSTDKVAPWPGSTYSLATTRLVPKLAVLQRAARAVVRSNEDPDVHEGLIVLTTRQHATGGDVVDSNQQVYELVLRGKFTCGECSRPSGAKAPTGDFLTLSMDRSTLATTDFGITRTRPAIPAGVSVYSFGF
jgi:hypothetical protein